MVVAVVVVWVVCGGGGGGGGGGGISVAAAWARICRNNIQLDIVEASFTRSLSFSVCGL